jgi:CIC family chloride channel protein
VNLRMGRSFTLDLIKVEEVMTEEVVTIRPDMSVSALEILFEEHHHTGYPVVKEGEILGIVTLRDVQRLPHNKRSQVKVGEIAPRALTVAYKDETVHSALDKMYKKDIGRLPVVDKDNPKRIIGIISKHDILRAHEIASQRPTE